MDIKASERDVGISYSSNSTEQILRKKMASEHITLLELSIEADVSTSVLQKLLSMDRKNYNPSGRTLNKVATALDMTIEEKGRLLASLESTKE